MFRKSSTGILFAWLLIGVAGPVLTASAAFAQLVDVPTDPGPSGPGTEPGPSNPGSGPSNPGPGVSTAPLDEPDSDDEEAETPTGRGDGAWLPGPNAQISDERRLQLTEEWMAWFAKTNGIVTHDPQIDAATGLMEAEAKTLQSGLTQADLIAREMMKFIEDMRKKQANGRFAGTR